MRVLLNGEPTTFADEDFPVLIHSREGLGASTFVINLIAELFREGRKILFFTAKPMAKEDLKNLLGEKDLEQAEFVLGSDEVAGKQAVIVASGKVEDFLAVVRRLPDMPERVVLVKNVEAYGPDLLEPVEETRLHILAGDLDRTPLGKQIWDRNFSTRICFSQPLSVGADVEDFPMLDKFHGLASGKRINGIVRLG